MLILFLQVVALLDYILDIAFHLRLHLLVPLGLFPLLVELLLELLYLGGDLLLTTQNFLVFALFTHKISSAVFDFVPYLLGVLEVHFFDLSVCSLYVVTELI